MTFRWLGSPGSEIAYDCQLGNNVYSVSHKIYIWFNCGLFSDYVMSFATHWPIFVMVASLTLREIKLHECLWRNPKGYGLDWPISNPITVQYARRVYLYIYFLWGWGWGGGGGGGGVGALYTPQEWPFFERKKHLNMFHYVTGTC